MISGGNDGRIVVRNLAAEQTEVLTETNEIVYELSFNGDGTRLVSATESKVQLWKATNGRLEFDRTIPRDEQDTGAILSVAFSPNGATLVWGTGDGELWLYDIGQNQVRTPLNQHDGQVLSVAFSPDSGTIASWGGDRLVMLWDVATGQRKEVLASHDMFVWSVAFSPDGYQLASASSDESLIFWNIQTPYRLSTYFDERVNPLWSIATSADGKLLATGDSEGSIYLYNLPASDIRDAWQNDDTARGGQRHQDGIFSLAFSSDATMLASGSRDDTLKIWNTATGDLTQSITSTHGSVLSVAFHPEENILMVGYGDGTIHVMDAATGRLLHTASGHAQDSEVWSVAFSSDGSWAASGASDRKVILWNVSNGWKPEATFTEATNQVHTVSFSPNSRFLAAGSRDGGVMLWNVASQALHQPQRWKHGGTVWGLTFSSDGTMLISAGNDGKIILWDVNTLQPLGPPIKEHTDAVNALTSLPDRPIIVSASKDQTIRFWDIDIDTWKDRACSIANRNLTAQERNTFLPGQPEHTACLTAVLNQANLDALRGNTEKARAAFVELTRQAALTKNTQLNNDICWLGSLNNFADLVMASCEAAVDESGFPVGNRDSRGLARALTGRLEDAKKDFEAYVKWAESLGWYEGRWREREAWIKALDQGRNPFDLVTLRRLRNQYMIHAFRNYSHLA